MSDRDDFHADLPEDIRHGMERMRRQHETAVLGAAERSFAATNSRAADQPPAPLEFHPFYRGMPALLDWLNDDSSGWHLQVPRMPKLNLWDTDDAAQFVMPEHLTLTRKQAMGAAPYVGDPFVYRWNCASDQYGRWIAGERKIQYVDAGFES